MKKIILFLIFSYLIQIEMYAQAERKFRFGVQTSPMMTWFYHEYYDKDLQFVFRNGRNLAFKLGLMGEYFFNSSHRFSIKTGVDWNLNIGGTLRYRTFDGSDVFPRSQLSHEEFHDLPDYTSVKHRLQNIEIPLSFKMRFGNMKGASRFRFFAEAPYLTFSYNTIAKADIYLEGFDGKNQNIYPDTNRYNASWGLGTGAEYAVGQKNIILIGGITYQQNFSPVNKSNSLNNSDLTIGHIMLNLGVMF